MIPSHHFLTDHDHVLAIVKSLRSIDNLLQAWTYSCIFQIALRVAAITTIIEEKISASVEHISTQIESQLIMEFDSINSYLIVSSYLNLSALAI